MDTIRSYLNTMFSRLQPTSEVLRAKEELLSMMEDKYIELIESGISENEAIGQVISEFGNLDEIADSLGIRNQVDETNESEPPRQISREEALGYISARKTQGFLTGLAVALFIASIAPIIILDSFLSDFGDAMGAVLMFVFVAAGVIIVVVAANINKDKKQFIKSPFSLSFDAKEYCMQQKEKNETMAIIYLALGIGLCILSIAPVILLGTIFENTPIENLGAAGIFLICAIGVWMIIYSTYLRGSYNSLLSSGSKGIYTENKDVNEYKNETARTIMSIYWPTVTCIYLSVSFLTFSWGTTWIIWVIAALAHMIIDNILKK